MILGVRRFAALDALRGLCACLVCLFHFKVVSPVAEWAFIRQSWLFVDFFFVLSGFVIAANYQRRLAASLSLGRFLLLRLGRIYPLHFVMLAIFVATELAALALGGSGYRQRGLFDDAHSPWAIVSNLFLLHSFGIEGRLTWNHPSWSVAVEAWCYLLFALAVRGLGRRLGIVLAGVAVVAPLLLLALVGSILTNWDYGLIRCAYGFALGAIAWSAWQRWGDRALARDGGWTIVEVAVVAGVAGFVTFAGPTPWNLLGPPLFAVAILVFAREGGAVSRLLVTPVPLMLGTLSYSIYMVHAFVQSKFDDALRVIERLTGAALTTPGELGNGRPITLVGADPTSGTLLMALMLVTVVAVSWLTYRYIELPGQRWSRQVADPHVRHVQG